jgi:hypothetical protein
MEYGGGFLIRIPAGYDELLTISYVADCLE